MALNRLRDYIGNAITNLFGGPSKPIVFEADNKEPTLDELVNQYIAKNPNTRRLDTIKPTQPQKSSFKPPKNNPSVLGASTSQGAQNGILDVAKYQGGSSTQIPLPNQEIQNLLWQYFPNEATPAAVVLAGENAGFNPSAVNPNNDGSYDYGLFQTNNRTINELLGKKQYGQKLRDYGINKPEDVLGDVLKSIQAASLIRQYEQAPRFWGDTQGAAPWSRWYGWQNKGYTIDPNKDINDLANTQGNPYFKLLEFVQRNNNQGQ